MDAKINDLQSQINALKNQSSLDTGGTSGTSGTDGTDGTDGIELIFGDEYFTNRDSLKTISYTTYESNYEHGSNLCFITKTGIERCIRSYSYDYSGDG